MKNVFILFSFLVVATVSFGQISFYKQYSNNGYDYGEGVAQTEDSSYLITGQSSSFIEAPAEAFILKVDKLGNFLWSQHYGGAESDGGKRIMYIENDGILVAGYTNSTGAGAYDFYLFKTDVNGNELWSETYGTSSWDRVTDAALTSDSGVIMIGQTLNTVDGASDILIVRTDKNGQKIWSQQIGGVGEDIANVIERWDDSTFAVGGKIYVEDSLQYKALLFRIQDDGTILWKDTLGTNGNYEINALELEQSSENMVLVGQVIFSDASNGVIENKCSINGTIVAENYGHVSSLQYYTGIASIGQTGKYATVLAYNNEYSYGEFDLSFAQNYNYLGWENNLAGVQYVGNVVLGQIISTSDFGAFGVGSITQIGTGGSNVFILKCYENGVFFNSNDDLTTSSLVSVVEKDASNELLIFPNPATSRLTIKRNNEDKATVKIVDNLGRLVLEESLSAMSSISVEELNNGSYFLMIEDSEGRTINVSKFIISR